MGGVYREIVRPDRLVNTEKFDGAWYPGEALITSVLVEKAGKTTLTVTMRYDSGEARDAVLRSPMEGGVAVSYDNLAELLASGALAISMFPPIATVSPLYLALRAVGLRDSLAGLVLPYATFALPLTLWLLTSFFRDLPDELYRAALVDGCTPWQAFVHVYLPLSWPALATCAILVFIFSWNELLYALSFISTPSKRTIPVAIALFAGEHVEPWGQIAAASVVATLPLAVLTFVFQRRIVAGLTAGAVKG